MRHPRRPRRSADAADTADAADQPVPVQSPLASPERAAEVGLVAGLTGRGVLQAVVTLHWRDVLTATRQRRVPGAAVDGDARFVQAGRLPDGAHRGGD